MDDAVLILERGQTPGLVEKFLLAEAEYSPGFPEKTVRRLSPGCRVAYSLGRYSLTAILCCRSASHARYVTLKPPWPSARPTTYRSCRIVPGRMYMPSSGSVPSA